MWIFLGILVKHGFTGILQLNCKCEEPENGISAIVETVAYTSHFENLALVRLVDFVSILHFYILFLF